MQSNSSYSYRSSFLQSWNSKTFDQIQCHNVLFLHKILNNKVPESVCETFAIMLHSHNTRSNNQIIIPQIITKIFGTYSIKYQCINTWNHFSNIFTSKNLHTRTFFFVVKITYKKPSVKLL